ncbi:Remorin_C domain-containing protein [Cephalotus follicularis]|uniref:Remorin_C domain-containing protein n=1 Tax=Cephalotus follicularis TaxID=3775 RepID=A0A1Q3CZ86_CEPFO|nr:Remorin_C domain-containing protein [Cephalotus follicularis]GAV85451.1 Remorin_C domain-containing protein [Cephalotus follicularis]
MRSVEDKGCYNHGPALENSSSSALSFVFHKGNGGNRSSHHRTALGKPTPSKWDDAQKWLVGLSRVGEKKQSATKPRNSNADDRRLIAPVPQQEQDFSIHEYECDKQVEEGNVYPPAMTNQCQVETKKVDCDESIWRVNKPVENSIASVRSISVRDMGTEMTPIASLEPSRTATPIRATTPAARSPLSSGSSTPVKFQHGVQGSEVYQTGMIPVDGRGEANSAARVNPTTRQYGEESNVGRTPENYGSQQATEMNSLETRAVAWDEAERAKYMARYKRQEVKIQAWENHQKRKAEMNMKKMEAKAERLKARAQERLANKLAATRRIAEEKRANAEAELNEKAVQTSERADYMRRTGHLPSSFSFKLPSCCW